MVSSLDWIGIASGVAAAITLAGCSDDLGALMESASGSGTGSGSDSSGPPNVTDPSASISASSSPPTTTDGPADSSGTEGATATDSDSVGPGSTSIGDSESSGDGSDEGTSEGSGSSDGSTSDGSSEDGGTSSGSTGNTQCEAPTVPTPCDEFGDGPSLFNAIGLGCPGGPDQAIALNATVFASVDDTAWTVATQLGSHVDLAGNPTWGPQEGGTMAVISNGAGIVPDATGVLQFASLSMDSNGNSDGGGLPAPISPVDGSGGAPLLLCDNANDCSDTLEGAWAQGGEAANDLLWFQFETDVPAGVTGFSLDVALFSEEWPEWVDTTFNDSLVIWSASESYTGNLCYRDGEACSVTGLSASVVFGAGAPELVDTGFPNDGGTGWLDVRGSVVPQEQLGITVALFDMGDTGSTTMALLDGFAWECDGCQPGDAVIPCGIQ